MDTAAWGSSVIMGPLCSSVGEEQKPSAVNEFTCSPARADR